MNNKIKLGAILLGCFIAIVSVAFAADFSIENKVMKPSDLSIWTMNSTESPREADVVLTLTNMFVAPRPSLEIILAIDGSGSLVQNGGTDPKRLRVTAAQRFIDNLDATKDRVGVVHWNDTVVGTPLALTSDFAAAKNYLNLSDARGATSIWNALNASENLLKNSRPAAKKIIILFSDGKDTSEAQLDFKGLAGQIKQSGVDIYAIGLGASNIADLEAIGNYYHVSEAKAISGVFEDVASDILGSLEKVQVKYVIPQDLELFDPSENLKIARSSDVQVVTWEIGPMISKKSKTLSFRVRSQNIGVYTLGIAPDSLVTYTKPDGTSGTQTIPSKEINVKGDGRFFYSGDGKGGLADGPLADSPLDKQYRLSVDKRIEPPSNGGCQDIVIDVKTPTVPCKKTVIFALDSSGSTGQSGLDANMIAGISSALLGHPDVTYARVDWDAKMLNEYNGPFQPAGNWNPETRSHPLNCEETDGTSYGGGLDRAVTRLANAQNGIFDQKTNAWIVIFIAGKSEFGPSSLGNILSKANGFNIDVYPIGVEIGPGSAGTAIETSELREMSAVTGTVQQLDVSNNPTAISGAVDRILAGSCQVVASNDLAKDIVLTESIYPYFQVVGTNVRPDSKKINGDGTTTLVWNLGDMQQNTRKQIVINTALDLSKLPVDVTSKRSSVIYTPATGTLPSVIAYTPIVGGKQQIPLPQGELSVFCGEPCISPKVSQVPVVGRNNTANATETTATKATAQEDVKEQPGFEALAAILGLMAMARIGRRD